MNTDPSTSKGARILLIEDDTTVLLIVSELLTTVGYKVTTAEDGLAGFEAANASRPDIILCDLMMPRMDGYEVLARLRQDPNLADIPVIFTTALAEPGQVRKGMNLGADDYLTKPFKKADLLRAIEGRLQKSTLMRRLADDQLNESLKGLAGMIHDLRNPVSAILSYSQPNEKARRPATPLEFQEVTQALSRINGLLESMMFFTRARFQKIPFQPCPIDPEIACHHVINSLPGNRRIQFSSSTSGRSVEADPLQLQHILTNLLENALRYSTPESNVTLTLSIFETNLVAQVSNPAAHIPETELPHLFQPFFRGHAVANLPGTGLGLAIVKTCVEQHGGRITVAQSPDNQVTFLVELPLLQEIPSPTQTTPAPPIPDPHPNHPPTPTDLTPARSPSKSGRLHVLIVDDEPLLRSALARELSESGRAVVAAQVGDLASARALLAKRVFDLIFLDVHLPDGLSFELMPLIPPQSKVVFASAYDEYAIQAVQFSPLAYLIKPITPPQLVEILNRSAPRDHGDHGIHSALEHKVSLPLNSKTIIVRLQDIQQIKAYGEYSTVILTDGKHSMVRRSLNSWEEELPAPFFLRIHRNTIVNLSLVDSISKSNGRTLWVRLRGSSEPLTASSRMASRVRETLKHFLSLHFDAPTPPNIPPNHLTRPSHSPP